MSAVMGRRVLRFGVSNVLRFVEEACVHSLLSEAIFDRGHVGGCCARCEIATCCKGGEQCDHACFLPRDRGVC